MTADLGQNIQFMVGKNISRATLDVNPANLGPMKITIDQQNNQTNIQIMASHHLAKDMLDQNMPRLREWLQDAGLGNAQVTVMSSGQDGSNNQAMNRGGSQDFGASAGGKGASTADTSVNAAQPGATHSDASDNQMQTVNARWRLDTFA
jgi:flagellar hook-length control protein FliK